ncbi:MAG: hypothetical protein WDN28_15120 [Chthoniobacter sp.]
MNFSGTTTITVTNTGDTATIGAPITSGSLTVNKPTSSRPMPSAPWCSPGPTPIPATPS